MTDAKLDARLRELLGMIEPPIDDVGLLPAPAAALPPVAPTIDNSTVAECVEIIPAATAPAPAPAAVIVAKTQTPVPTAPKAKPLSDAACDQAYFLYTTGTIVAGPAN